MNDQFFQAAKRLQERNNLTEKESLDRINSQPSNCVYAKSANILFSTLWSYKCTHIQIERAWNNLLSRVPQKFTIISNTLNWSNLDILYLILFERLLGLILIYQFNVVIIGAMFSGEMHLIHSFFLYKFYICISIVVKLFLTKTFCFLPVSIYDFGPRQTWLKSI